MSRPFLCKVKFPNGLFIHRAWYDGMMIVFYSNNVMHMIPMLSQIPRGMEITIIE